MIPNMRTLMVPLLIVGAIALAACGGSGAQEDDAAFARAAPAAPAPAAPAPAPMLEPESGFFAGATQAPLPPAPPPARAPRPAAAPAAPAAPALVAPPRAPEVAGSGGVDIEEAVASLVSQQRIIVRTVDISLMVSDVPGTIDVVADLAEGMGGWVISTNRSRKHLGSISVRVPAAQLDEAVLRLREMAVEVESEVSTSRDVTDEYVDATARLENLLSAETTYRRLLEESTTDEGALRALNELTRLQGDIESLQGRIKLLEETSAFSLINVTLEQEPADMPVDAAADQTAGVGGDRAVPRPLQTPRGDRGLCLHVGLRRRVSPGHQRPYSAHRGGGYKGHGDGDPPVP